MSLWEIEPFEPDREVHIHYSLLAESIRERGLVNPVIVVAVDKKCMYRIVQGHWRVLAARTVGVYRIPVHILGNLGESG